MSQGSQDLREGADWLDAGWGVLPGLDDLGWNTAWHNPDIHSPTLNALAKGGVELLAYVALVPLTPHWQHQLAWLIAGWPRLQLKMSPKRR